MMGKLRQGLLQAVVLSTVLAGSGFLHLNGQEPADQDKTGQGATGKKQPLPALNDRKTSSNPGEKVTGDGKALQPAPGEGKNGSYKSKNVADNGDAGQAPGRAGAKSPPEKTAYDFELPGADGKGMPLAGYKGKVLLVVNLARNSSYNSQLAALEKLNEQYKDKGLVVIGIPSNEFGAAEPGTDPEIQKVYHSEDKVTFPVTAKAALTGSAELPFYDFLTKAKTTPESGPVHWNYTKFLLDKSGKVVARFGPDTAPDSPEMLSTIEQVLSGRFKPRKAGGDRPGGAGGADDDSGL